MVRSGRPIGVPVLFREQTVDLVQGVFSRVRFVLDLFEQADRAEVVFFQAFLEVRHVGFQDARPLPSGFIAGPVLVLQGLADGATVESELAADRSDCHPSAYIR